jgi:hypothetical protein
MGKLSAKPITTVPTGGYVHIITPDGFGGWVSYRISHSNFLSSISSAITALQNYQTQGVTTSKETNKTADFTKVFAANTKIESIDFKHVSGTPVLKVGETISGDEISPEIILGSNEHLNILISKSYESSQTIYITLSGGTVNVNFNYRTNYF